MARAPSSIVIFSRQRPCRTCRNFSTQIRKLTVERKEIEFISEGIKPNQNHELPQSVNQHFTDVTKEVAKIMRTKSNWEQTLMLDFPSFNFTDPQFFWQLLKQQNNAFLSLRFFHWLHLHSDFVPDQVSCSVLFDSLLEAKACNAAKYFLQVSSFTPEQGSLERYICCLCDGGMVNDALDVFVKFKDIGICPSIATWNSALLGCLVVQRTDLVWKLYHDMLESRVVADIETVEYLIRAFCYDGKFMKGYQLLRQVLEEGLVPRNIAFNALISGFCKLRNFVRVSELLHTMIAKNCAPDIYTYQEVINGLCKNKMLLNALRIFNDLKNRGYSPDRVMYTTMIHGLCEMGWIRNARKLWFEMINKGILPNEYTYNSLIHGTFKNGEFRKARKLYDDMRDRGYGETTASYNMMITHLCLCGRTNEGFELFKEMAQKGIIRDVISYNAVINGFCKKGMMVEGKNLLNELLAHGIQPSSLSYIPLIKKLCELGDMKEAKQLWNDMQNKGLKPMACDYDHFISALCVRDHVMDGMDWLVVMLKNKLRPKKKTFETLIKCVSHCGRLDVMSRIVYYIKMGICNSLVWKFDMKKMGWRNKRPESFFKVYTRRRTRSVGTKKEELAKASKRKSLFKVYTRRRTKSTGTKKEELAEGSRGKSLFEA
ncbi:hypothetical protein P3X46_006058 [Hevea brasiliensis]|uniref:Pentacotripeptide-repeat region of PRORP domain-containing protein n=1 Tax=Hevea brasiliensis TaxID=3981 RepID=A0ABQ9MPH1_HEVBR|nr:pentatricopeptide repeat-containing protein At5g18950 [Hevea brasiliensis]XP_058001019.1 pentatricopeptide repeat-containing protein At5g18950 [Hevea brasiliensis]KAJ9182021.1 hypothetical protein P3X46_006058 [Hevea brasiliensis]KAJ9182022.1 hypothetical protein P3X46_006058 [Hevea brasiliensis]